MIGTIAATRIETSPCHTSCRSGKVSSVAPKSSAALFLHWISGSSLIGPLYPIEDLLAVEEEEEDDAEEEEEDPEEVDCIC